MAEIKRYLVLNAESKVVNIVKYDGEAPLVLDEGYSIQEAVEGQFYDIGMVKQEDGNFKYVWRDLTLHDEREEIEETPGSKTKSKDPA